MSLSPASDIRSRTTSGLLEREWNADKNCLVAGGCCHNVLKCKHKSSNTNKFIATCFKSCTQAGLTFTSRSWKISLNQQTLQCLKCVHFPSSQRAYQLDRLAEIKKTRTSCDRPKKITKIPHDVCWFPPKHKIFVTGKVKQTFRVVSGSLSFWVDNSALDCSLFHLFRQFMCLTLIREKRALIKRFPRKFRSRKWVVPSEFFDTVSGQKEQNAALSHYSSLSTIGPQRVPCALYTCALFCHIYFFLVAFPSSSE